MHHPGNPGSGIALSSAQAAARKGGCDLLVGLVPAPAEIEAVLVRLAREPSRALIVPPDPFVITHRKQIVELATAAKMPIVSATRPVADEGGLIAYGAN